MAAAKVQAYLINYELSIMNYQSIPLDTLTLPSLKRLGYFDKFNTVS